MLLPFLEGGNSLQTFPSLAAKQKHLATSIGQQFVFSQGCQLRRLLLLWVAFQHRPAQSSLMSPIATTTPTTRAARFAVFGQDNAERLSKHPNRRHVPIIRRAWILGSGEDSFHTENLPTPTSPSPQPFPCARPLLRNEGICLPLKNSQSPKLRAQRLKLKIPNSTKWLGLVVGVSFADGDERKQNPAQTSQTQARILRVRG